VTPLIIHGHFYQPPRENPWTGIIDPEPGAQPFHDWNERIYAECYEPNSAARIVVGGAEQVVNNYAHISFDFGPTLLSWLQQHHEETYKRIIAADLESAGRHNRHGNAIAHAYNHAILPLCNSRDRRTQVRWGIADFRCRFGREPESMWLPETACNDDVLGLLIDEGLRFVILAPQQAQRVRSGAGISRTGVAAWPGNPEESSAGTQVVAGQTGKSVLPWRTVDRDTVDTSVAYRYFHRDGSGRSIAVFFYDPELAHGIAFGEALVSSKVLIDRLAQRRAQTAGLINIATDGETYGHHHKFGDLCLAYTIEVDAKARGFTLTNYGEYLEQFPPELDVEISNGEAGEGSSWSCIHGVSRWIRDCGCQTGGKPGWNQAWRGPLRAALDYLRDEVAVYFEATRARLFTDPWAARDDAVSLVLDEFNSREEFLRIHAPRELTREQQQRALKFLELQRQALLMYTSCGWFFSDISGIEPMQILKYAGRALDLMNQLDLPSPRERFLEILAEAKSNRPELGNGADIFRREVEPVQFRQASDELLVR
jgi:alpha-amylase/alpha-mannosidase (GH57 family)